MSIAKHFPSRRFWSVVAVIVAIFVDTGTSIYFRQIDTDEISSMVHASAAEQAMFNHSTIGVRTKIVSSHAGLHAEDAQIIANQQAVLDRLDRIEAEVTAR